MTRRLLLSYLAVTLVVLALLEVPLGIFYAQRESDRFTADVERDASVIATIYEDDLEAHRPPDPAAADRYQERTGARVVVVDDAGISVVDTDAAVPRDFSRRPEIEVALQGARSTGIRRSDTLDTSLLYVAVPVASGGVVHGALRITLDAGSVDARTRQFWIGLAGVGAVITVIVGLGAWVLARSVTRPIRHLSDSALRYAGGDLSTDDQPVAGPREIRELGSTLDTMARRLAGLIDEQRAFVADASHQLRTPLTAMRLRLENLQARAPADQAAELDAILDESDRLAALIADLLQLARADEQDAVGEVDLRQLVEERAEMWVAFAADRGITVERSVPDETAVARAVPGAVEQVLDNVLDNALNVSPAGGTVLVELIPGPDHHELVVTDEGPGLSDDDKDRAVRRFWRGDASTTGTGLGLAIAVALIARSRGTVELIDAATGGLRVVVRLPAAVPSKTERPPSTPTEDRST